MHRMVPFFNVTDWSNSDIATYIVPPVVISAAIAYGLAWTYHPEIMKFLVTVFNGSDPIDTTPLKRSVEPIHKSGQRIITGDKEVIKKSSSSIRKCIICYEFHERLAFFQPCGHFGACQDCLDGILSHNRICPVCRTELK
jgi:hypothetical protein